MEGYLIFFLFALLAIGLMVLGYFQAEKRKKELAAWAGQNGFTFDPGKDRSLDERYADFSCLRSGSDRYAYNLLRGRRDPFPALGFDYHYETYSTDSKGHQETHHHYFSAMVIETRWPLRPLFIRPEGFFDKLTELLGFDDIDFESTEFSRSFYVKSPDKKWAYDVLHQKTMEFLLNAPRFTLEFSGNAVIAYRSSTFATADFPAALEVIEGILNRFPEYLLREMKGVEP